jgi:hypothetical protein
VQGSQSLRPSSPALAGFAVFVLMVTSITAADASGLIGLKTLAASPRHVFSGRVWLLVTSGLVVQKPLALSVVSFAVLGMVTLAICRWRVLVAAGLIGHIASTVLLYCVLALTRSFDHRAFAGVWSAPDYGVSAVSAAWLGALASIAWRRSGKRLLDKTPVIASCAAIVAFSWLLHPSLNVLDSEHVVAFGVGAAIGWRRALATAAPLRALLRAGSTRRVAIVVACVLLALSGASFAEALRSLTAPDLPVARLAAVAQSPASSLGDPEVERAHVISIRTATPGGSPFAGARSGRQSGREYLVVIRGRFACLNCALSGAGRTSFASFAAATWTPRQGLRRVYLSRRTPVGLKHLGNLTSIRLP